MTYSAWGVMAVLVVSAGIATAQDRKIERSSLPPAVAATVDRETKGAQVLGFATEVEHGKKVYEAETIVSGHTRDLQIAKDGTLNEVEEEVALDSLPAGVRDALLKKAGTGKVTRVESLTKQGKLVAYEAETLTRGRKGSMQVGPAGEKLSHEE